MKQFNIWLIFGLVSFITVTCASQWKSERTSNAKEGLSKEVGDTLKLEDLVLYTDEMGVMYFNTSITQKLLGFTGDSMFINYGYLFDIGEHNKMEFQGMTTRPVSKMGTYKTFWYNLHHKGFYAVRNAAHFVEKNGRLTEFWYKKYDMNVDTTAIRTQTTMLAAIKPETEKYKTYQAPSVELLIRKINGVYKLVYEVKIESLMPFDKRLFVVDASSLEILIKESMLHDCNVGH